MAQQDQVSRKVTKAVAAIVLDAPFFGYILLRQELRPTYDIKTAATNGKEIMYNPDFFDKLSSPELKAVIKHEVMHVVMLHHLRRQDRDPKRWNVAADYVINALLLQEGDHLPEGALIDATAIDKTTEHVYATLPEEPENPDGPGGGNEGGWDIGGVLDHPSLSGASDSEREILEQDAKTDVIQAANTAKIMGKMPGNLERLVDKIRESKMPWARILARFFKPAKTPEENWSHPNRRWLAHDIFMPSRESEALGPVVLGIDTSGSIQPAELDAYFACLNSILKHAKPEIIHVVYCDCRVASYQTFTSKDLPLKASKLRPAGYGGTRFQPVFDYIAEKRIKPEVVLYLTDMYGSFDFPKPKYPVFWCATSQVKAPWGKTLEVDL